MNDKSNPSQTISLPKGGGAIKGIGETFQPNVFTGTGNFSIPIATSPGRGGFGPKLSLQYSTGNGNGPFGLGWQLSIPGITRKTEKGLPKYLDAEESDVFIMSGAEDLVPCLKKTTDPTGSETWAIEMRNDPMGFRVTRYRPRTEGLFARIEKWENNNSPGVDVHWRATTKDNITSIYGRTSAARISDPVIEKERIKDPTKPAHVYEWLLQETFDAKGNHILYEYARDDASLILTDKIYEHNRTYCQLYIRRIYYGNISTATPIVYADGKPVGAQPQGTDPLHYVFEIIFDYGDLNNKYKPPAREQELFTKDSPKVREDSFSTYRSGFEIRTLRRCERVLMYHHFKDLGGPTLVKSTDLNYETNSDTQSSLLTSATVTSYQRIANGYASASMPPVTFTYSAFKPHEQRYQSVQARDNDLPPLALNRPDFALVDLFGDGLPDILHTSLYGFRYWKNLGGGLLDRPQFLRTVPAGITLSQPGVGFGDMDGDGRVELLIHNGPLQGFFEATPAGAWENFKRYDAMPSFDLSDPNVRLVDLTGDGRSDALMTRDHHFLWFECQGEAGFAEPRFVERVHDLDKFPDVYFEDPSGRVRLADMTGDGLQDIVLLHNGRVDYWPNVGYGEFGHRITMGDLSDTPVFDFTFDPRRLFLVDLDGSGCADLVYVDFDRVHFWFNRSGNTWSERQTINGTPPISDVDAVRFADIFGTGTATLVWSYDYGTVGGSNYKALDFCGGVKPHVLTEMTNNMGATTRVRYVASTKYARDDAANGTPWGTQLPFPVHVLEKVETIDHIGQTKLVTTYSYHHGYFDGREREFRGFGRVDQCDTEAFEIFSRPDLHSDSDFTNGQQVHYVPPVVTKSWFHTGAYFEERQLMERYRGEFYSGDPQAFEIGEHEIAAVETQYTAHRALRGSILRSEVYALDGTAKQERPYAVTENVYKVDQLQPGAAQAPPVYLTTQKESLSYHYERNPADPRVGHQITLSVDDFGNITDSISIGYPRRAPAFPEQKDLKIVYSHTDFINKPAASDSYYLGIPCQKRVYEVTGITWTTGQPRLLKNSFVPLSVNLDDYRPYQSVGLGATVEKRIVEWTRSYFRKDDGAGELDIDPAGNPVRTLTPRLKLGEIESLSLPYEAYQAAFTDDLLKEIYHYPQTNSSLVTTAMMAGEGGYHSEDGYWWIPSGQQSFDKDQFYLPKKSRDPFGNDSLLEYDEYDLLVVSSTDSLYNKIQAHNDYRVLQPDQITDPNGNISRVAFDTLGLVAGVALMGKDREPDGIPKGDSLTTFTADVTSAQLIAFMANPRGIALSLLGSATSRMIYDLDRYRSSGDALQPIYAATIVRETHGDPHSKVQVSFLYSDGFGREIQKKIQAEAGSVDDTGTVVHERWVGSGWTVFNNKGKPVQQYEPFFSAGHQFEFNVRFGVTPTLFYDPLERVVCTLLPNNTYEKVIFDPWKQTTWDVNDTVHRDPRNDEDINGYASGYIASLPDAGTWKTWYEQHINSTDTADKDAAQKALLHADTPAITHLDTLGRVFLTVADNKTETIDTRVTLDIEGNDLVITDPRKVESFTHKFDIAGRKVSIDSKDAGLRLALPNVAGKPIFGWDTNHNEVRTIFDKLQRPIEVRVSRSGGVAILAQHIVYGESRPNNDKVRPEEYAPNADKNLRGQVYKVYDGAGVVTNPEYDFKSNLQVSDRQLTEDYTNEPEWSIAPPLSKEIYRSITNYDALNRTTEHAITANVDDPEAKPYRYRPTYNEANLLSQVNAQLPDDGGFRPFVRNIDYNEKGQRTKIEYENEVTTEYTYDHDTFRLLTMISKRVNGDLLQSLGYTYDPVGNITQVAERAFESVFNANQRVEPISWYTYDPLYRLTEAKGREHELMGPCAQFKCDKKQTEFIKLTMQPVNNGQALRNYTETYRYDESGNLYEIKHAAGPTGSWTRTQSFQVDTHQRPLSNRLVTSQAGCEEPAKNFAFDHDPNGNITKMPYLSSLTWDYANRLQQVETLICTDGPPDTAFYSYDATGQRVRKVIERGNRASEERIYLGDFEIYREYNAMGKVSFERQTFHVMDDKRRVAMVERRTVDTQSKEAQEPSNRFRYQFDNHLGSSLLEVDEHAKAISYEEYYPYGGTAYLAGENEIEVKRKRYRYSGKERDDETGLYYYGARYYAPWLGRWVSCDPLGKIDGFNLYSYSLGNPANYSDPNGTSTSDTVNEEPSPQPDLSTAGPADYGFQSQQELDDYIKEYAQKPMVVCAPRDEWLNDALEFASDLVSGFVRGALEPLLMGPVQDVVPEKPTQPYKFGSALADIAWGAGSMLGGLGGGGAAGGMMVLSDGTLVPVLSPALVVSGGLIVAGGAQVVQGFDKMTDSFAKTGDEPPKGGAHGDVKKGSKAGVQESNHSRHQAGSPLPREQAPALGMEKPDHRRFDSTLFQWYRDAIANISETSGFRNAQYADMQRIIDVFGPEKYAQGLYEMEMYTIGLELSNPWLIFW